MAFSLFLPNFIMVRLYWVWRRVKAKRPLLRMIAGTTAWILLILSGASLIAEVGDGLYLNAAGCLVGIVVETHGRR